MRKLHLLILSVSMALSGCRAGHVVVPDTEACTVAGVIAAGAICAHTLAKDAEGKPLTRDMTMDEYFDFLEPKEEGENSEPARAGAVCESTNDYGAKKTALEQACRILGKNCTYEMQQAIEGMKQVIELAGKQVEVKRELMRAREQ